MSFLLNDSADTLHYEESGLRTWQRVLLGCIGLSAIGSSYGFVEMLYRMGGLSSGLHTGTTVLAVCGIVSFCGFGAFVIWLALFAPAHTLVFDVPSRRITHRRHSLFMHLRDATHDFGDVAKAELIEKTSDDGDTSNFIVLTFSDGKKIRMGAFTEQSAAADCLRRVRQLTAQP